MKSPLIVLLLLILFGSCGPKRLGCGPKRCEVKPTPTEKSIEQKNPGSKRTAFGK
jgi:hypothetical protein